MGHGDHDADGISRTIDNDSYDTERDTDGQLRQHRQYGSRCRPLEPIAGCSQVLCQPTGGKTVEPLGHGMKIDVWRAGSGPKEEMYAVVQHGASWQSTSGVRSVDTHRKGEVWHIPASSAVICIGARIRDRSPSRSPTLLLGSLMYFSDF